MARDLTWLLVPAVAGLAWFATTPAHARVPARPKDERLVQVWELASQVERETKMPGFTAFALAVARRESRGNPQATRTEQHDADRACDLYEATRNTRFSDNPYGAERFCFGSGGLYQFLPAVGLSAPSFREQDPYLVFDPAAATAMLADFVRRVMKGYWHKLPKSCRNWATINRFMASNRVGLDCDAGTYQRSRQNEERFAKHLRALKIPVSVMRERVRIGHWPGDWALYQSLSGVEGSTAPPMLEGEVPL